MRQMDLSTMQDIDSAFPDGKRCRWLKTDIDSGVMAGGEVYIMGTCRLMGGTVYDRDCSGCNSYTTDPKTPSPSTKRVARE